MKPTAAPDATGSFDAEHGNEDERNGSVDPVIVYYDGECPFCSAYAEVLEFRQRTGLGVELRNAREWPDQVEELRTRGYEINSGMLAVHGSVVYQGHRALHTIATLSTRSARVRDLIDLPFRSEWLGRLVYPFARAARRVALALMGREAHVGRRPSNRGHD